MDPRQQLAAFLTSQEDERKKQELLAAQAAENQKAQLFSALDRLVRAGGVSRGGAEAKTPEQMTNPTAAEALKQFMIDRQDKLARAKIGADIAHTGFEEAAATRGLDLKEQAMAADAGQHAQELDLKHQQLAQDKNIEDAKLRIAQRLAETKASKPVLTPDQQSFGRTIGANLANWKSEGGSKAAELSIQQLKAIRDRLKAQGSNLSGGFINKASTLFGETGKNVRGLLNPQTEAVLQEIGAAALPSMKAMFPGPTSDRELKTFMELSFDPKLDPQTNALKLDEQIKKLEARKQSFEAQEAAFNTTGSVGQGMEGAGQAPDASSGTDIDAEIKALEEELGVGLQ